MSDTLDSINSLIAQAGIKQSIDRDAHARIARYFSLRQEWARAHNIAGPQAMKSPWRTDLLDAIALTTILEPDTALVDVGSGSGTPGFIIGCLLPELSITLVEPIAKRTAFLRQATHVIGLPNVKTHRGRWPLDLPYPVVQVVSRAVVPPEDWPTLALIPSNVGHIIRMLATNRPVLSQANCREAAAVDYLMPDGISRRIERWRVQRP
jgi:16S rRNA G527 N7-methylase RsmG